MPERRGARGYIASRPIRGSVIPQRVQNLVIRDYCTRRGLVYLVSSAEYAMPECYMMLENVLRELPKLDAIVCFSVFMLPAQAVRRHELYARIFSAGAVLHAALENLELRSPQEIERFEDLLSVAFLLDKAPLGGRYEKTDQPLAASADPFVRALAPFIN